MIFKEGNLVINVGKKPKNRKSVEITELSNRDKSIRDRLLKKFCKRNIDKNK